jgi:hypothetical protein
VGVFNIFNFANFNLPADTISAWSSETCALCLPAASSINPTHTRGNRPESNPFRVGNGTGVCGFRPAGNGDYALAFKHSPTPELQPPTHEYITY